MSDPQSPDVNQGAPVLINIYDLLFKQVSINNNLFVCSTPPSATYNSFKSYFKRDFITQEFKFSIKVQSLFLNFMSLSNIS